MPRPAAPRAQACNPTYRQVCFFGSDTNGLRRRALHALRNVPGAVLHLDSLEGPATTADERGGGGGSGGGSAAGKAARKAARKAGRRHAERRRTLASRVALRACKLCLVPAGITASSRRFYEACARSGGCWVAVAVAAVAAVVVMVVGVGAGVGVGVRGAVVVAVAAAAPHYHCYYPCQALGASCVPLLLADDFEPAFTALLPPEQYAVRAAQQQPEALPKVVGRALQRWPALFAGVQAARSAFGLGLGAQAARSPRCDALHAVVAELSLRFRHRVVRRRDGGVT